MKHIINLFTFLICSFGFTQIDYDTQIQPIFDANCVSCHSNGATYTGGIELTSYVDLMAGGYNTDNTNVLSVLEEYVITGYMPAWGAPMLSSEDIDLISQWVFEGGNPSGMQDGCTLSDGSNVPNGWSGSGVGDNWCNDCFCEDGILACSYMDCGGTDCIDDPDGILESYSYQCNDIVGSWFSWVCDDDLSVAIPELPSGMWTIGDLCPESCDECETIINGCTDPEACNYDDSIIPGGFDDGSCEYPGDECEGFDQQLQEVVYGYLEENCECALPLSIDVFLKNKEIIKTVNVLGQKSHINSKEQISIYIYDDGSVERKYIIE